MGNPLADPPMGLTHRPMGQIDRWRVTFNSLLNILYTVYLTVYWTYCTVYLTVYWTYCTVYLTVYWTYCTVYLTVYWTYYTVYLTVYWTDWTIFENSEIQNSVRTHVNSDSRFASLHVWLWLSASILAVSWKIMYFHRARWTQTLPRLWPHSQKLQDSSGIHILRQWVCLRAITFFQSQAGRTPGSGWPHLARGPQVGRPCSSGLNLRTPGSTTAK